MLLVDYKLEFGVFNGEVVLGDEFSPDGCRLWDKDTREKLDKDRFRQGLGGVVKRMKKSVVAWAWNFNPGTNLLMYPTRLTLSDIAITIGFS